MACAFSNVKHVEAERPVTMKQVQQLLSTIASNADDPEALIQSCAEISSLTRANPNNSSKIGPKGVAALVSCLEKHSSHAEVAGRACQALGDLANGNFINKKRMGSTPVVKLIAQVMREHPKEPAVLLQAMEALEKITDSNGRNAASAVRAGVQDLIWRAMTSAAENVSNPEERETWERRLQQKGGNLLGVCTATGPNILDKIAEAIVASMKATPADDQIAQGNGCQVLKHLANAGKESETLDQDRDQIEQQGAVPLLLKAIKSSGESPKNDPNRVVVSCTRKGTHFLFCANTLLSFLPTGSESNFSISNVVVPFHYHQIPALATLKHLAWASGTRQQHIAQANAVPLVLETMDIFAKSAGVQTEGCALLRNLAWHQSIRPVLLRDGRAIAAALKAMQVGRHRPPLCGSRRYALLCVCDLTAYIVCCTWPTVHRHSQMIEKFNRPHSRSCGRSSASREKSPRFCKRQM